MNGLGRVLDVKARYLTSNLIRKLKEHLDDHIIDYAKAMKVYEKDFREKLDKLADAAKSGDMIKVTDAYTKIRGIVEPIDASKVYKQYIDLLGASSDDTIELTIQDANAIINDEWDWAVKAKTTNSFYSSR